MVIVIDLSEKLIGFNLFENFFYQLKKDGNLVFANNPLTVDDNGYNYEELRATVQNILFDNHINTWNLCVIYDMDNQKNNPIKNSITSNTNNIYKNIIEPLQNDYSFGKLYYISLDEIKRNFDGVPLENSIKMAIEFDSKGYISNHHYDSTSDFLFTENDIDGIDDNWDTTKSEFLSNDGVQLSDPKKAARKFSESVRSIFKNKIDVAKSDDGLGWYVQNLVNAQRTFLNSFEDNIYANSNSINSLENPSVLFRDVLHREVSSYKDQFSIIIHFALNDKETAISKQDLMYRKQLQLFGLLIYLATNDTKQIFGNGQALNRENHWEINSVLNDEMLSKMLVSYNRKLKAELDKLGKFASNEIEYEEYAPKTFNLSSEMKKPKLPAPPVPGMFAKNSDNRIIEEYANRLYKRYIESIECANKRIRDLTAKLRIQKEADSSGTSKKGTLAEISAEIDMLQKQVAELHEKIAFYRPKEAAHISSKIKADYNEQVEQIKSEMNKRINSSSVWHIIIMILGASVCTYPVLQLCGLPNLNSLYISLAMLVVPSVVYLLSQISKSILLRKRLVQLIGRLTATNEKAVNDLFSNDNSAASYIQNIYDLIMLKKYINECNAKIIASTKKFKNFNYHHDKLKEHIEVSDKLIEVLSIDTTGTDCLNIEKMQSLDGTKSVDENRIYCPLNYYQLVESVSNKAIVNDQQNVKIDNNTIGFIDKFIIKNDKEYQHD